MYKIKVSITDKNCITQTLVSKQLYSNYNAAMMAAKRFLDYWTGDDLFIVLEIYDGNKLKAYKFPNEEWERV